MSSDYLVAFPGLGIDPFPVNRVAFSVFGLPVYWYGLIIAIAAVFCMILAFRDSQKFNLSSDDVVDIMLLVVPLMIVFARLYYVAFQWDYYRDNLARIFDTRDGGLAFYGGVIGGVIGLFVFSKWKNRRVGDILDFCAVYVPLGQAIGRWGNFFNQEAFGTNTKLPWGMISNGTADYFLQHPQLGQDPTSPVHPTFLYEFIANIVIFFILLKVRKESKIRFETFSWYVVLYGAVRFFVESIRTDSLYIGQTNLRVSMLISALMVLGGLAFLGVLWLNDRRMIKQGLVTPDGTVLESEIDEAGTDEKDMGEEADESATEESGEKTEMVESADGSDEEATSVSDDKETAESYAKIEVHDGPQEEYIDLTEIYQTEKTDDEKSFETIPPDGVSLETLATEEEYPDAAQVSQLLEDEQKMKTAVERESDEEFLQDEYAKTDARPTDEAEFTDVAELYDATKLKDSGADKMIEEITAEQAESKESDSLTVDAYLERTDSDSQVDDPAESKTDQ